MHICVWDMLVVCFLHIPYILLLLDEIGPDKVSTKLVFFMFEERTRNLRTDCVKVTAAACGFTCINYKPFLNLALVLIIIG